MIKTSVRLKLDGLNSFRKIVKNGSHPAVVAIKKKWEARYRSFVVQRFDKYSKGGGDWPPLAPSTIARRRRGKGKRGVTILVDTGLMRSWLVQGIALGKSTSRGPWSTSVEFSGGPSHGSSTVGQIAGYHDKGGPNLPRRQIFAPPPSEVIRSMAQDAERTLQRLGRDLIGR